MSEARISAFNTLGETFSIIWREKQLFILLIAFLSIVSLIFIWPLLDWYVPVLADYSVGSGLDPATTELIMDDLGYIFIGYIPFLFFTLAPLVLWSRASIGGTGLAMAITMASGAMDDTISALTMPAADRPMKTSAPRIASARPPSRFSGLVVSSIEVLIGVRSFLPL